VLIKLEQLNNMTFRGEPIHAVLSRQQRHHDLSAAPKCELLEEGDQLSVTMALD
jgi:hypothetical protein